MKIAGVSLYNPNFAAQQNAKRTEALNPFLCTANEAYKPKSFFKDNKADLIGGLIAIGLAFFSFKKFFGRNSIPKSVVELSNKKAGLGKLEFGERTSSLLKDQILYPMKAILLGDSRLLDKDLKTGLIIADKDEAKVKSYVKAFLSHAKELGIHIEEIKYPNKKQPLKDVHKAISNALAHFGATGECTIVNIGDLGKISNLKVGKMESASNIEKRLAQMPKGVLWTAWTTAGDRLPYFYNNIPTLSVKIVD